uniref:Uncharacterized protein n=1 Tax=Plectus sambesii TaxID=2011161 RepID=A0A914V8Q0_9BILA
MFGRRAHSARDDSQIGRFAVGFVPFERLQRELFVAADVAVCRPVESKPALAVVRARCRVKSRRAPVTRSIVDDKSPDLARFMRFGLIDHRAHPFVFCRMAVAATAATAPLPPQPPPPPLQLTTATATTTAGGSALENYNLSWKGRQQPRDPNGNIRSMKSLQQSFPNPDAPAAPSSSSLTLSSSLSSSAVKPLQRRANNNSMSLSMDNVQLKDALRTRNNCRYVCVLEHIYILNCLSRSPTGRSFRGGRRSATRRQAVWPNRKSDSLERLILASGRNGNKIGSNEQRISCCRCDGWRKQETREPSAEGYR